MALNRFPGNITQSPLGFHERFHAWVTVWGGPTTIKESHNVSSVTKDATGDYTITWAIPFAASAYAVVIGSARSDSYAFGVGSNIRAGVLPTTTSLAIRFTQMGTAATRQDPDFFSVGAVGLV